MKIVGFIVSTILLLTVSIPRALAQTGVTDSNTAFNNYIEAYRAYQTTEKEFVEMRSKYLTYQTIISQSDMLEKTKVLLKQEQNVLKYYATFIRIRLLEATSILKYQENLFYLKLDDELANLTLLTNEIDNCQTISEAQLISNKINALRDRVKNIGYMSKALIEYYSAVKIKENVSVVRDQIGTYLSEAPGDNNQMRAAREKFGAIALILKTAETELTKAEDSYNIVANGTDFSDGLNTSRTVRNRINNFIAGINRYTSEAKEISGIIGK